MTKQNKQLFEQLQQKLQEVGLKFTLGEDRYGKTIDFRQYSVSIGSEWYNMYRNKQNGQEFVGNSTTLGGILSVIVNEYNKGKPTNKNRMLDSYWKDRPWLKRNTK